jgi:hypothetical protein
MGKFLPAGIYTAHNTSCAKFLAHGVHCVALEAFGQRNLFQTFTVEVRKMRSMVRVELHRAKGAETYHALYEQLATFGITNEITATDGRRFRLPPAEYYYDGAATRDEVLRIARQCANAVDQSNAVVVTESNGVTWEGLQELC